MRSINQHIYNWHIYPNEKPKVKKKYIVWVRGCSVCECPYFEDDVDVTPDGVTHFTGYCKNEPCNHCSHFSNFGEMKMSFYDGKNWSPLDTFKRVVAWTEIPDFPDLV